MSKHRKRGSGCCGHRQPVARTCAVFAVARGQPRAACPGIANGGTPLTLEFRFCLTEEAEFEQVASA